MSIKNFGLFHGNRFGTRLGLVRQGVNIPAIVLPLKVAILGDSQSAPVFNCYCDQWAALNPSIPYFNQSIGGESVGIPSDYGTAISSAWGKADNAIAAEPSIISILIGGNDNVESTYGRGGALGFYDALIELVAKLKIERPGVKVIVFSNLPDGTGSNQNVNRPVLYPLLRGAVGSLIDDYIPLGEHPRFTNAAASDTAVLSDTVHMTPASQAVALALFQAVIDPIIAGATGNTPSWPAIADVSNATASSTVEKTVIITGMGRNVYVPVSVDTGTASIGQGAFSTNPGTVKNGDTITLRVTANALAGNTVSQTLTVGSVTDTWVTTTAGAADVTAPTLSSPTDVANGSSAGTLSVTTNEANGTLYWFISTSATPPTAANLKTGTGAITSGSQAVSATGAQAVAASGLTASTAYYSYFLHRDAAGNDSAISAADGFTTGSADTTAPTLSSPTDAANGQTGATLSVSTNEGNGTLYWFISTSGTPPTAANLKTGTGAVSSGSQTVSGTGVQNSSPSGLTAATAYFAHFLHRDAAGNDSAIASGDGFTTAAATGRVAYIKTYTTAPNSTWNAFNTTTPTPSTVVTNIKDTTETNTGWALAVTTGFAGTIGDTGSATSSIDWVPSSVLNSAFYSTNPGVFTLSGLDNAKTYTLDLASNRNAGTTRNTIFVIEGVDQAQINSSNNWSTVVTASNVSPGGDGSITIGVKQGSPNDITFGYINAIRITESS